MIRWAAHHPVVGVALIGIVLCLGWASVVRMPVRYLGSERREPLWVSFQCPSQPGRDVILERLVRPFEQRVLNDPRVKGCNSFLEGSSWAAVSVEIKSDTDPLLASGSLDELAATVAAGGPAGTRFAISRSRPESAQAGLVMQLFGIDPREVTHELVPLLRSEEGIRRVEVFPPFQTILRIHPQRPSYQTALAIHESVAAATNQRPIGVIAHAWVVPPPAPVSIERIEQLSVRQGHDVVPLGELAHFAYAIPTMLSRFRCNGNEGLFVLVWDDPQAPRRTGLSLARRTVKGWIGEQVGAGYTIIHDRGRDIRDALLNLGWVALQGLFAASLVVYLVWRSLRPVVLITVSIILTQVLTLILLAITSRGLDVVSAGALVVSQGPLFAIMVLVVCALSTRGETDPLHRITNGMRTLQKPLFAGGVVQTAILLPAWLAETKDQLVLRDLAWPLVATMVASLVVISLIVPSLAMGLTPNRRVSLPRVMNNWVKSAVQDPILWAPSLIALAILLLVAITQYAPLGDAVSEGDPRRIVLSFTQPPGGDPELFSEASRNVEKELTALPGVEWVIAFVSQNRVSLTLRLEASAAAGNGRRRLLGRVAQVLDQQKSLRWQLDRATLITLGQATIEQNPGLLRVEVRAERAELLDLTLRRIESITGQSIPTPATDLRVILDPRLPGGDLVHQLPSAATRLQPISCFLQGRSVVLMVVHDREDAATTPPSLASWLQSPKINGAVPADLASHRIVESVSWPVRENGAFVRNFTINVSKPTPELTKGRREELRDRLRTLHVPPGVSVVPDVLTPPKSWPWWVWPAIVALSAVFLLLGMSFESLLSPLRVMVVTLPFLAGAMVTVWLFQIHLSEASTFAIMVLVGLAMAGGIHLEHRFLTLRRGRTRAFAAALRVAIQTGPGLLLAYTCVVINVAPLWFVNVRHIGRPFAAIIGGGVLFGSPCAILILAALQAVGSRRPRQQLIEWRNDGRDSLTLRSLSKSYDGGVKALVDATTRLDVGMVGLLGPNGAGKTTLLRCLVGILKPDTGDAWVNDVPRRKDMAGWRRLVGYLPQTQRGPSHMPARAWLELWATELRLTDPITAAESALAALDVIDLGERRLGELSGGQRRRVCVARALLGEPRILVVDEPTTGLDPQARVDLRMLLGRLSRDRIVLLSTHIAEDVANTCRRVLVLLAGRLIFDGDTDLLIHKARGKVRSGVFADDIALDIAKHVRIVSRVREIAGLRMRFLAPPDFPFGLSVEPTLEEAYLALGEEQSPRSRRRVG